MVGLIARRKSCCVAPLWGIGCHMPLEQMAALCFSFEEAVAFLVKRLYPGPPPHIHQRHAKSSAATQKSVGGGRVQRWRGSVEGIRPGDVIQLAAGEKHCHGATSTTARK